MVFFRFSNVTLPYNHNTMNIQYIATRQHNTDEKHFRSQNILAGPGDEDDEDEPGSTEDIGDPWPWYGED